MSVLGRLTSNSSKDLWTRRYTIYRIRVAKVTGDNLYSDYVV